MWRHGWLGDWRRWACMTRLFWPVDWERKIAPFDKDTPFLKFDCISICLATNQPTNQVFLNVKAGIHLSHRRGMAVQKCAATSEEWRSWVGSNYHGAWSNDGCGPGSGSGGERDGGIQRRDTNYTATRLQRSISNPVLSGYLNRPHVPLLIPRGGLRAVFQKETDRK